MAKQYQHILVALDGSQQSEKAFEEALQLAENNYATLYLASIINDADLSTSAFAFSKLLAEDKERVEATLYEKSRQANEKSIAEVVPIIEVGNPKQYLTETFPEQYGIDLIVMGVTGKGKIRQTLVGSTTAYVVNHAPCNVLVVK
ncbi:MAG: universal stress protein [Streptococcaceae bacterium]|jgi:nucleotide-binding universal stress UspA family protein|nr:universal stress protein [Streptococcaceae bacterium]